MKISSPAAGLAAALVALGSVGCAISDRRAQGSLAAATWPDLPSARAAEVYRVDRSASHLWVRVDPAGPMARLGHSHIIGGAVLAGRIGRAADGTPQWADLCIDVAGLEVDRPAWRRAAGLKPGLDPDAIAATRANLLGPRVLDAARHPLIGIRSAGTRGPAWQPDVAIRVRLGGEVRALEVPVTVVHAGGRLEVGGRLEFDHADFGLEPFAAAGGALRVAERIRVRFRIVAVDAGDDVAIIGDSCTSTGPPRS